MILKQLQKQVDGSLETQWLLTEAQTKFLLNFAITELIQKGLVQVLTEVLDKQEVEESQKQFLEEVDPNTLYKA